MPKGFLQNDQPLGLPKGSIRAIIALAVVITWVVLLVAGALVPKEFYVILGAIVTFYFMARENDHDRQAEGARLEEVNRFAEAVIEESLSPGNSAE